MNGMMPLFFFNCFFAGLSYSDFIDYFATFCPPLLLPWLVVRVVLRYGRRFSLSDSIVECCRTC